MSGNCTSWHWCLARSSNKPSSRGCVAWETTGWGCGSWELAGTGSGSCSQLFFGFVIPMLLFAAVVNPMRIIFVSWVEGTCGAVLSIPVPIWDPKLTLPFGQWWFLLVRLPRKYCQPLGGITIPLLVLVHLATWEDVGDSWSRRYGLCWPGFCYCSWSSISRLL